MYSMCSERNQRDMVPYVVVDILFRGVQFNAFNILHLTFFRWFFILRETRSRGGVALPRRSFPAHSSGVEKTPLFASRGEKIFVTI